MTSTVEVLRAARALYERAPSHAGVDETPEPGTYCVLYALLAAAPVFTDPPYVAAEMALRRVTGFREGLTAWNAHSSTETVLAAFDLAIEAEVNRAQS